MYTIDGLCEFLSHSHSVFHAVDGLCSMLDAGGFVKLNENAPWDIKKGGKYYVTRNLSSVLAFTIPQNGFSPFMIAASHSDSPTFRVKENAEIDVQSKYTMLNTEPYGGAILSTWLDRPLSVAGRVFVKDGNSVKAKLVDVDRDCLVIPNLAPHMDRSINDGMKYDPQTDMQPLLGNNGSKGTFKTLIAEAAGVSEDDIVGSDLYLYSRMEPSVWGKDNCYISAGRLDDLECAYTSMCALIRSNNAAHINICCVFDNEEVGSSTRQGAGSTLLEDVIARIAACLGADDNALQSALASSFIASCDNAHAMHPNHGEKADVVNRPFMNEGVVIKFAARQSYTTDGLSRAVFTDICDRAGVKYQIYHNKSNIRGGGTLGNISLSHVSIPSVDIGLAQLAMHSSYETAGAFDAESMVNALKSMYETELKLVSDSCFELQ